MRTPSAFLRSLSLRRIQPQLAVAVAPLPVKSRFDQQLAAELDILRSQGNEGTDEPKFDSAFGLVQLLDASIATQKIALDLFSNITYREDMDRSAVDEYLESNIQILDTCNYFVEKIDIINKYVNSLRMIVRLLDGNSKPNAMAITRALEHLESCQATEEQCKEISRRVSSCLRRMLKQNLAHETEFTEIICGSKVIALMACRFLEQSLSFDSKLQLPMRTQPTDCCSSWLGLMKEVEKQAEGSPEKLVKKRRSGLALMVTELQQTANVARNLKEKMKGKKEVKELKYALQGLRISLKRLEDGVEVIEGRIKDLYKSMIDVRMVLLGILSQA